jgi:hypothetical protein
MEKAYTILLQCKKSRFSKTQMIKSKQFNVKKDLNFFFFWGGGGGGGGAKFVTNNKNIHKESSFKAKN